MVSAAATAFLALIGGVITLAIKLLSQYMDNAPERKRKEHALATSEAREADAAMAAVDAELDGVRDPQREPILLSPDDRL